MKGLLGAAIGVRWIEFAPIRPQAKVQTCQSFFSRFNVIPQTSTVRYCETLFDCLVFVLRVAESLTRS